MQKNKDEIIDKDYLPKLHKEMLVIYDEIERICNKNGLDYFVVGGTLLGTVLWKDYIPWDDDLDIAMPRDDYDRFIKLCETELDERFFLHHTTTDDDYWLPFAKLRLNSTIFLEEKRKNVKSHAGIYVDIFPFDYASSKNGILHRIKWRWMTWINNHINCRVTGKRVVSKSAIILEPIFKIKNVKQLSLHRDKVMRSFDIGDRKYFVDLAGGRVLDNSYFNIEDYYPIKKMPFGDKLVNTPSNPEKYLLQLYTEKYKIIPPKEQQITHEPLLVRFTDGTEYKFNE